MDNNKIRFLMTVILSILTVFLLNGPSSAGDGERTAYTIMSIDHQFFATPYERAAIMGGAYMGREGTPASVILNPAALYSINKVDAMVTFTQNSFKGIGGGVGRNTDEAMSAELTDTGIYAAIPLGKHKSVLALGADVFNTTFSRSIMTCPDDQGSRFYAAISAPLGRNLTWGYGLMYLDDSYAWGTAWFDGRKVTRCHMKNTSQSWRHRLAVQGKNDSGKFRWGLQGTFGYGEGDNYWNGVRSASRKGLQYSAVRGGGEWILSAKTKLACDLEWQWTDIQFGNHPATLGHGGTPCYYEGHTLRAMMGLEQKLSSNFALRGGYRFSSYKVQDLCGRNAIHDSNTAALGFDWKLGDTVNLSWNGEYQWMGYGDFSHSLSLGVRF